MEHLPGIDAICQVELHLTMEKQEILRADAKRFLDHWEAEANETLVLGSNRKIRDMAEDYLNIGYDDGHGDKVAPGKLLWDTDVEDRPANERSPKPSLSRVTKLFTNLIQMRTNTSIGGEQQDKNYEVYDSVSDEDDGLPDIDKMMQTPSKQRRPIPKEAIYLPANNVTAAGAINLADQRVAGQSTGLNLTDGHKSEVPTRSTGERSMAKRTGDSVSRNPKHSGQKRKKAYPDPTTKENKGKKRKAHGLPPAEDPNVHNLGPSIDESGFSRHEIALNEPSRANELGNTRLTTTENVSWGSGPSNLLSSESLIPTCPPERRVAAPQLPGFETLDGWIQRLPNAFLGDKAKSKNNTSGDNTRDDDSDDSNEPLARRQKVVKLSLDSRRNEDKPQSPQQNQAESPMFADEAPISPPGHLEAENNFPDNSSYSDMEPAPIINFNAEHTASPATHRQYAQRDIETPSQTHGRSPTLMPSPYVKTVLDLTAKRGNMNQNENSEDKMEGIRQALGTAHDIEAEERPLEDGVDHTSPVDATRTMIPGGSATRNIHPRMMFFILQDRHPCEKWIFWKEGHSRSKSLEAVFEAVSRYSLLPVSDELKFTLHFADKVWTFDAMRHEDEDYSWLRDSMIDVAIKYPHEDGQVDSSMRFYVAPMS